MLKFQTIHFSIIIVICFSIDSLAQESRVFDNLSMKSEILGKEKLFGLYLPPGYDYSQRTYPVIYLLHGGGRVPLRHKRFIQNFEIQRKIDSAISNGSFKPMIIVMPDAEMSYYMNNISGKYQFEDFFINEMIPYIEKNYRCRTEKRYRGIAGTSMGGYGALLYSLHHPDKFSASASIGAAVRTDQQIREMPHDQYLRRYRSAVGDVNEDTERITEFWNSNSILHLVEHMSEEQKGKVKLYFVIGDDDYLYKGNSLLHILMKDLEIPHEYRVVDGGHGEYFESEIINALKFISENF